MASGGATDVGVTATEIHVGIGILDIGAAKQFGFNFDIGDQRARYDALIASVNKRGGINGRKVVPHYRVIEVSKQESFQAACISWTKDDKVFAVFLSSQTPQAASVCIIGEGNTPFITSDGIDDSYYANGNYFSVQPNDNRVLHDQALYLLAKGVLKGKTVGVLTGDGAERLAIDRTLIPELARGGIKVAAVEVVPADTSGTQKMPIAVSNFKDAGVDYVIIAANVILAGPFVQSADRSGLKAEYGLSDFNNQINDQVADYYPDSFDGTVGLSTHRFSEYRAGSPPPPADKACLDIVHPVDPKVQPSTNSAFEVAMMECAMWTMFVAGVTRAGAALNRGSFRAGVEQIGPTPIAGILDGSYGPGKHDGGNTVREVAWHKSCSCWQIAGPQRPMR